MQPLVALIGFVMGSSVALLLGLTLTLVVFLLIPEFHDRLSGEYTPLLGAIAWAALLTGTSVTAFIAQLKVKPWRRLAQLALAVSILLAAWNYWPTR